MKRFFLYITLATIFLFLSLGLKVAADYYCPSNPSKTYSNSSLCDADCLYDPITPQQCVPVGTQTHKVCTNGVCTDAPGAGTNECENNAGCSGSGGCPTGQTKPHSECQNGSCVSVQSCGVSNCSACGGGTGGGGGSTVQITNPLQWNTIEELIKAIVKFLQELALVVTAIVIVLAGYFFVTSMGDPAKVSQAKKMVLYALIGLAIILMAQGIIALIETVIKG